MPSQQEPPIRVADRRSERDGRARTVGAVPLRLLDRMDAKPQRRIEVATFALGVAYHGE
jgi:hypothetical protein